MIRRKFIYEEHREHGGFGFRPLWLPNADPASGMTVAHDVLEHFPHDNGSVDHEFKAFGAMMFVRGVCGWWAEQGSYYPDPAKQVGGDFYDLLSRVHEGDENLNPPGIVPPLRQYDDLLQRVAKAGCEEATKELQNGYDPKECVSPEEHDRILGWMRLGFRAARRRYSGCDPYDVQCAFTHIKKVSDDILKRLNEDESMTGAKLIVHCDPTPYTGSVTVELLEQWE